MNQFLKKIWLIVIIVILFLGLLLFLNYYDNIPLSDLETKYKYKDSQTVNIVGMDVHYRITGSGDPILLIHGDNTSLHIWEQWTKDLSQEFKVISLDLPGYGLTGKHFDNDYSIKAYCDFIDVFLDKIGIQDIAIVGNDLGGEIAWQYTLDHKNRINKLVLIDSEGFTSDTNTSSMAQTIAQTPYINQMMLRITPKSYSDDNIKSFYHDPSKIDQITLDRHHELSLREGNRLAYLDRMNQNEKNRSEDLGQIEAPTLILWGEQDTENPVKWAKEFDKKIPNSNVIIYENTGHLPMMEVPEISSKDIIEFIKSSDRIEN